MDNFKIVSISCSTRYRDEIINLYNKLTCEGCIVLADLTDHDKQDEFDKEMVDRMHLKKIDMAEDIYFLVKDNHMGESVTKEFEYAKSKNKNIKIISF